MSAPIGRRAALSAAAALAIATALHAQIDPRTALLERAGIEALNRGDARAAADAFRDALTSDPRNARLHLGAGMAAALEHRDADALTEIERALALDPSLRQARVVLGQLQHRAGDLAAAIATYEIVVREAPADPAAAATLDRWRRERDLHDRMQQTIDAHFTVSFEGPEEASLAAAAVESLDRAYWRIGDLLGSFPSEPVSVVLYSTEQFHDITRSPAWAAGAYDGLIRVPMRGALDNPRELDRVLAHEFTHALVRTLAPRGVPAWLNEGLATALETGDLSWANDRVRDGGQVPLAALVRGFGAMGGADAERAYASSALAVRRMLDDAGGMAVANLLRDLGRGEEFSAAFLHRIQRSFADFQSGL